jgi:hypothetical protein
MRMSLMQQHFHPVLVALPQDDFALTFQSDDLFRAWQAPHSVCTSPLSAVSTSPSLHPQWQTFALGSLRGLLPASGLLLSPRRPPCSPSGLLAACTAVRLVHGRAGWALAEGWPGSTALGGCTPPGEKAV